MDARMHGLIFTQYSGISSHSMGARSYNGICHDVYTLEKENIDAILHMDWPCNASELCMFIGYANYYHTFCRVAHISLNWIDLQFDNLFYGQTKCKKHLYNTYVYGCKSIACPDHNKWFSIHINASHIQLGSFIIQEGRPVAYSSCNWQCHSKIILHRNSIYFHHSYSQRILKYAP